jgi:hypothetical protein
MFKIDHIANNCHVLWHSSNHHISLWSHIYIFWSVYHC